MIEGIEYLDTALDANLVGQSELLAQARVHAGLHGPTERIAPQAHRTVDGERVAVVIDAGERIHRQSRGDRRDRPDSHSVRQVRARASHKSMLLEEIGRPALGSFPVVPFVGNPRVEVGDEHRVRVRRRQDVVRFHPEAGGVLSANSHVDGGIGGVAAVVENAEDTHRNALIRGHRTRGIGDRSAPSLTGSSPDEGHRMIQVVGAILPSSIGVDTVQRDHKTISEVLLDPG